MITTTTTITGIITGTTMHTEASLSEGGLYRLMTWLSPSFPVGGYTYSHGLEWAVEEGLIRDRATLTAWISGILDHGSGRLDADLFRETWSAVTTGDVARFDHVAELADALRGTPELALESLNQGQAFLLTVGKCWTAPGLAVWQARLVEADRQAAYAVAVALVAACHQVPLRAALGAFLHAVTANLVSAAVRLVPLGQTDGQHCQADLEPVAARAVMAALHRDFDDLGTASPMVDLCSIAHETQYTRLFRS